ncbi:MAG: DUF4835 family protein [Cruoricaptor ignavus]|nr:DUF4835 family protein [Cruoricaptor ignavus]
MKKLLSICLFFWLCGTAQSQELLANVTVNYQQLGGSNVQVYKTLEKSLRDFINNTSWTGKKLQNFEKIKCNFAIVVNSREGNNRFKTSIVVQAVRPVYNSTYESPLININDTNFEFEYNENENLIFNERQFTGKNLIDVLSFYIYMILGYDGDSFKMNGGQQWFQMAQKISQNSQNQRYAGWSVIEGPRTRGGLIDNLMKQESNILRNSFYAYHRTGLDNMNKQNQSSAKKAIAQSLMNLKYYENNFQMNYPFNVFIESKRNEIYDIFANGNNSDVNIQELKTLMNTFSPKDSETKWNKWK